MVRILLAWIFLTNHESADLGSIRFWMNNHCYVAYRYQTHADRSKRYRLQLVILKTFIAQAHPPFHIDWASVLAQTVLAWNEVCQHQPCKEQKERTWQCASNIRFAYAGSVRSEGHGGKSGTLLSAAFQRCCILRPKKNPRSSLEVRVRWRRSLGPR